MGVHKQTGRRDKFRRTKKNKPLSWLGKPRRQKPASRRNEPKGTAPPALTPSAELFKRRWPHERVNPQVRASHALPIHGFDRLWHLAHGRTKSCPSCRPVFQYNKAHSTPSRLLTVLCSTTNPQQRRPRAAADFQAASPFNMASMNCSPTSFMSLRLEARTS